MSSPAASRTTTGADRPFSLRALLPGVYLPTLLAEIAVGAAMPVIAATATGLGADLALAGVVVALVLVGQILADIPAGALATRIGDRRAMLAATGLAAGALAAAALAPSLWVLAAAVLALGAANAVFGLARQSYLTAVTPVDRRARALSTLCGVGRIGLFVGPFLGAGAIALGSERNAYWLGVAAAVVAGAVVLAVPDVRGADVVRRTEATARSPLLVVLRRHRRVLTALGTAILLVGAVRGARQVVLPLWSEHLGLDAATTSLLFGLSAAVDMLLFYPAGHVMDRFGRLWIVLPSMAVMGVTMLLLPFTTGVCSVAVVGVVMGLGNGIGSGVVMTLGADVAPTADRAQFLGAWRMFQDAGSATGPLLISAGAALGSLAAGIWAIGVLSVGTCAALGRWVPRWSVHATRSTRRRAGLPPTG